ncbi:DNA-binding protein, partial [Macellibacteroides fermentans]
MNIDRETFIAWMERIMDRFEMADKKIERLTTQRNCLDGEQLLDNQDLMFLLKV